MVSYYFGGKEGLLKTIAENIARGIISYVEQFDLEHFGEYIPIFRDFLLFLEDNRNEIRILLTEIGKDYDFFKPIQAAIGGVQDSLTAMISGNGSPPNLLKKQLYLLTDIILGMVFSDFLFDFSQFQDLENREASPDYHRDKIDMIIRILKKVSGEGSSQLYFDSILNGEA